MTIDPSVPTDLPAVSVRTSADERAVQVAAKLASGTAEAFGLGFGPSRRLSAVAIEATRNVVEHAYAGLPGGDVEIGIAVRRARSKDNRHEVLVSVRDFGSGCALTPTSNDPPGLGLSMMSELSETLAISSTKHAGTEVRATIGTPADAQPARRDPASHGSRIDFTDPIFLAPVIPRAIAVHATGGAASIDAVREAINGGRAIAACIDPEPIAEYGATLSIDQPEGSIALEVRMGPMPHRVADGLSARLGRKLLPAQEVSLEPNGESSDLVKVELPLL